MGRLNAESVVVTRETIGARQFADLRGMNRKAIFARVGTAPGVPASASTVC